MQKAIPEFYASRQVLINLQGEKKQAWTKDVLLDFIGSSTARQFVILGGKVVEYLSKDACYAYTHEGWYIDHRDPLLNFESYAEKSHVITKNYLIKFPIIEVLYIITLSSEVTAGL